MSYKKSRNDHVAYVHTPSPWVRDVVETHQVEGKFIISSGDRNVEFTFQLTFAGDLQYQTGNFPRYEYLSTKFKALDVFLRENNIQVMQP